jgi:N-acetyltransferase 10
MSQDDAFELFISATDIRYTYYAETHKVLGNTFGMCVLQVSVHYRRILIKKS